jgi:hypothetical protein
MERHLASNQEVGGSIPSGRTSLLAKPTHDFAQTSEGNAFAARHTLPSRTRTPFPVEWHERRFPTKSVRQTVTHPIVPSQKSEASLRLPVETLTP